MNKKHIAIGLTIVIMLGVVGCGGDDKSEEISKEEVSQEMSLSTVVGQIKTKLKSDVEKFARNVNSSIDEEEKKLELTFYTNDGVEYTEELKTISLEAQKYIYSELEKYNFSGYEVATGFMGGGVPVVLIDADGNATINNYIGKDSLDNSEVINIWKTGKSAKHHSRSDCGTINSSRAFSLRIYANEFNPCSKCF